MVSPVMGFPLISHAATLLPVPSVFSGVRVTRSLVVYVCFVDRCLSFCTFSFGHCVVCSSSIYGFWLPLWYLQTLLVLLYFFFWPLCCLFFFDIRFLITPLVSSNSFSWIAHKVILHIQLLCYQKKKSLIITSQSCVRLVFPWGMRIIKFPYCTWYEDS